LKIEDNVKQIKYGNLRNENSADQSPARSTHHNELHPLNSLKVRNLNAKISWKPCLVVFGSYLLI
jgi:hypothetical protein